MIQPNEIRVGNILNYLTDEDGLLATTIDWQDIKYCTDDPQDFNRHHFPIPLTEEILLKCGFEIVRFIPPSQTTGSDLYYGYDYAILKIGPKTQLIVRFLKDKFKIEGFYSSSVKSFHQLQNLFFALTGKELEVNL